MERRREPRLKTDHDVLITLLGDPTTICHARVVNFSGHGMRLLLDHPLPRNTPIRIDWSDSLFLGEVCYNAELGKEFAVGIMLDQVLQNIADLAQLARAVVDSHETLSEPPRSKHPKLVEH